MRFRLSCLSCVLPVLAAVALPQPSSAAGCTAVPTIRFQSIEADRIVVEFNENCTGETWSKVWARGLSGGWSRIRTDFGDHSGWRPAVDDDLQPLREYCYEAENYKAGVIKGSSRICATTPRPSLKLGLIAATNGACGTLPNPSPTDSREHVFISAALADQLGIDSGAVTASGPSPQVRVVIDRPLMTDGGRATATYTVARVCTQAGPHQLSLWMWNDDKLYPTSDVNLATLEATIHPVAPGTTTWSSNGVAEPDQVHFFEPNFTPNGGCARCFRENVSSVDDKRVALLVPHGGGIERNTSAQIAPFVAALAPVGVNVWESEGQWSGGGAHDRWHITAGDIHRDGFPGLDRLLGEPELAPGRSFQYAVALHGFGDASGIGIILGGRADRDVLCHVAAAIQDEAGSRGDEIGFHIANAAADGQDLRIANALDYIPGPSNVQDLEGTAEDNLVNRLAHDSLAGSWGGIQLEQSACLRRQMDCDLDGDGALDTCAGSGCMHEIVARGVARGLAGLVDSVDPVDPAGACCTHFDECP